MTLPAGSSPPKFSTTLVCNSSKATRVLPNAAPGLILNNDPLVTVWVGADSSVSPGNGVPLGPAGGSTQWGGGDTYMCLDTGVSDGTVVTLTYTNNAANPSNPLAVAEALIAQGIPSVLLTNIIVSAVVIPPLSTLGNIPDIGSYASLECYVFGASTAADMNVQFQQTLSSGQQVAQEFLTQVAPNGVNAPNGAFVPAGAFVCPVAGQKLRIINQSAISSITVTVIASNRAVSGTKRVLPGNACPPRELVNPTATGAGVRSFLQAAEGGTANLPDWTSFNGQCTLAVLTNAYNGSLNYIYEDLLGGVHTVPVLTMIPATTSYVLQIPHPFVNLNWAINSTGATPANSIALFMTPNNTD